MKFSFIFCAFLGIAVTFLQGCSSTVYVAATYKPETIEQWAEQAFPKSDFADKYFTFTTDSTNTFANTNLLSKSGKSIVLNERFHKEINDSFSQFCNANNTEYSVHYGEIQDKKFLICAPADWDTPTKQDLRGYNIGFPFVMLRFFRNFGRENTLRDIFVVSEDKALKLQFFNQYDKVDTGLYAQGNIDFISNNQSYSNIISAFVSGNKISTNTSSRNSVSTQVTLVVKAYKEKGDYQYIPLRFIHLIERSDYKYNLLPPKIRDESSSVTWNIKYSDPTNNGDMNNLNASSIEFMPLSSRRDYLLNPIPASLLAGHNGDRYLNKIWYFSPLGETGGVGHFSTSNLLRLLLNWHDYKDSKLSALEIRKNYSKKYVDLVEAINSKVK